MEPRSIARVCLGTLPITEPHLIVKATQDVVERLAGQGLDDRRPLLVGSEAVQREGIACASDEPHINDVANRLDAMSGRCRGFVTRRGGTGKCVTKRRTGR